MDFKLVYPAFFALAPVGVYCLASLWVRPKPAYLCASLVLFQTAVIPEIPALARQEIGLLLWVALLLAAFSRPKARVGGQLVVATLALTLVLSHYSTAYIAEIALLLLAISRLALRVIVRNVIQQRMAFGYVVVGTFVGAALLWNGPVTHSTGNLSALSETLSTQGLRVLPNKGSSIVDTWLNGTVARQVSPSEFFAETRTHYVPLRPWLLPYGPSVQLQFPAIPAAPPAQIGSLTFFAAPWRLLTTSIREVINVVFVLGVLAAVWHWLRRSRSDTDLVLLSTILLVVTSVVRISGSLSQAYNPERLALQTSFVLVIPAVGLAERVWPWFTRSNRRRVTMGFVAAILVGVLYGDSSGVVPSLVGSSPGNIQAQGEYRERFYTYAQDIAGAAWLGVRYKPDAAIYSDRYGVLKLEAYAGIQSGLFSDLTPATLDQRAYVFATTSNVQDGRARGAFGSDLSTYVYPLDFLMRYKSLIYSNGSAEVFN